MRLSSDIAGRCYELSALGGGALRLPTALHVCLAQDH